MEGVTQRDKTFIENLSFNFSVLSRASHTKKDGHIRLLLLLDLIRETTLQWLAHARSSLTNLGLSHPACSNH